jgi:cis-3-alkyl-4-acyloxetan-2-one decarboxylase
MRGHPVLRNVPRANYPWTPKRHVVDDIGSRMAYLEEGDPHSDQAIVLLHGNPTWSFLWRAVIRELAPQHRIIAPDHIGFGVSDKPRDPSYHTLERHIRNLTALLRHLGPEKVTLVAHDWGGPIGLGWAIRNTQLLKGLVLTNTWAMRPDKAFHIPAWYRLLRSPGMGEIMIQKHNVAVDRLLRFAYADSLHARNEILDAYRAPFPFPDDRVAILRLARLVPMRPGDESYEELGQIEAGLAKLQVPTRIVWGAHDHVYPQAVATRLAQLLPNAQPPRIIPDTGHLLPEEAPGEIVEAIRSTQG